MTKLSQRNRAILRVFGLLGLLVILTIILFKVGVKSITEQNSKLSGQLKKEKILVQKAEILSRVEAEAQAQAEVASFALPSQNSSFVVISQLKTLAASNLLILTNIRVGGETKDGNISVADISFDLEGPLPSIFTFLQGLSKVAPLTISDKVQINQAGEVARANVRAKAFWAAFPETLPALSEPANDLTKEEKEILVEVLTLNPPEFEFLEAQPPRENVNPF